MSPGPYLNSGLFGGPGTQNDLVGPKEELGLWRFDAGRILRYVKSGSLIPRNEAVRLDFTATTAALIGRQVVQTDAPTNILFGIADNHTFANLSFGWVTVYGNATSRVTIDLASGIRLGPTATTGVLGVTQNSSFQGQAIALATGVSSGSAVHVCAL